MAIGLNESDIKRVIWTGSQNQCAALEWVKELYPNVAHWREYDKGGHFAAFEVPETFVRDLRDCFGQARRSSS